jgi:phosphopantetheine adenylyltransferase
MKHLSEQIAELIEERDANLTTDDLAKIEMEEKIAEARAYYKETIKLVKEKTTKYNKIIAKLEDTQKAIDNVYKKTE